MTGWVYLKYGDAIGSRLRRFRTGRKRSRAGLSVGSGGEARSEPRRRKGGADTDTLDEVDRILDKIRADGMDSLSESERRFLDEMSRKYKESPRQTMH